MFGMKPSHILFARVSYLVSPGDGEMGLVVVHGLSVSGSEISPGDVVGLVGHGVAWARTLCTRNVPRVGAT